VALPVTLAWLTLAPLYASHYGLGEDTVNTLNPLLSLISAASMLPSNFHPLLLAFLLLSSCVAWITSDRWHRQLLLLAWAVALPVAIVHHGIAGQVCIICIGVARYNILLLLPAALSVGCLLVGRKGVLPPLLAITTVLVSLYLTPFSFVEFTQKQRIPGSDIMHTPTEGYLPGPVIPASAQLLQEYPESLIIVAPQYGFLDWFAARGLASLPNLKELQKRSMSWDPSSPLRPVVIQAPVTTTYLPSITQEQEQRLKEIRTWARKQTSHTTIQFGTEEIIIVH
jgi:hypothetical protein